MPSRIEDYALIGDCQTAALVARDGSIDWLCFPRFDSGACFAALLGTPDHGRWQISPANGVTSTRRRYRENTLIVETDFVTPDGEVTLIDFMPVRDHGIPEVIRVVEGKRGKVPMKMELIIRFDYGSIVPWVQSPESKSHDSQGITATGGPDKLRLWTNVQLRGEGLTTVSDFTVAKGQSFFFDLAWHPSNEPAPEPRPHRSGDRLFRTWPLPAQSRQSRRWRKASCVRAWSSPAPDTAMVTCLGEQGKRPGIGENRRSRRPRLSRILSSYKDLRAPPDLIKAGW